MRALGRAITGLELPAVEKISEEQAEDPFQILIATLLSARTQDATTHAASTRLFKARPHAADDGEAAGEGDRAADLSGQLLSQQGAAREGVLRDARRSRFGGTVPATMEELVMLPGVGRKTANLVLILGFKSLQNICVDTHVHRISNRLGWVQTTLPEETEQALYRATDSAWWPLHQPVSRDLGAERLPAGLSALRGLRRSRTNVQELGLTEETGAGSSRRKRMTRCVRRCVVLRRRGRSAGAWRGSGRAAPKPAAPAPPEPAAGAGPVLVFETVKGIIRDSRRIRTKRRRPSSTSWRS